MEIVKYRDWVFEADSVVNETLYQTVETPGTQSCACEDCQYFESIAAELYPDDVKQLFKQLGIDIKKNFDVSSFGGGQMGNAFNGQFHFKGGLIEGPDCYQLTEFGGYQVNLLPVSDNFKIGFTKMASQSFFTGEADIIKIEFMARVP
ncbi:hypothetical protein [Mucilaginibacter celer]|uniref:Uncharacterized protein n=1 Tax=Mucilaginibacter celer TaxID=2305508 RepID=A0A494VZC2_9SPHI|nr:hypothetical protein [Mucilaginibacter celer]AYL96668.1 hypothetical protein HYN43_015765 [Mucilaginibacter celer]